MNFADLISETPKTPPIIKKNEFNIMESFFPPKSEKIKAIRI